MNQKANIFFHYNFIGFWYLAIVVFYIVVFFTNLGNYVHGGSFYENVLVSTFATFLCFAAYKLWPQVSLINKVAVIFLALVPITLVIGSIEYYILKYFVTNQ